jgi:Patched family
MHSKLKVINLLLPIKKAWEEQPDSPYRLEFYMFTTVPSELTRAITQDLPLIPLVFAIMSAFTCIVFLRTDIVQSRGLLGLGSVVTILLSITSGFGLAFIIGLPFTSMTSILPFVVFGIGLDDTFVIVGAHLRTDPTLEPIQRVQETMEQVGLSNLLTTITTLIASAMGFVTSNIPAIQYLCFYGKHEPGSFLGRPPCQASQTAAFELTDPLIWLPSFYSLHHHCD